MPSKHKTALLGWHPGSAEDAAWARAEAKRRGVVLRVILDEALAAYRAMVTTPAPEVTAPRRGKCKHEHAVKGWCRECRTGGH